MAVFDYSKYSRSWTMGSNLFIFWSERPKGMLMPESNFIRKSSNSTFIEEYGAYVTRDKAIVFEITSGSPSNIVGSANLGTEFTMMFFVKIDGAYLAEIVGIGDLALLFMNTATEIACAVSNNTNSLKLTFQL